MPSHTAPDTVMHRCFLCPYSSDKALLALGNQRFQQAISAPLDSLKFNRCLVPMPKLSTTRVPAKHHTVNFDLCLDSFKPQDGRVYTDGSCFFPTQTALAVAGYAVVQVNPEGEIIRAVFGPVPWFLPQSPLMGECVALTVGHMHTGRLAFATMASL